MIQSPGCPLWRPDLPGPAGASAIQPSATPRHGTRSEGAEAWACLASLIETCKLNEADPEAYLADVLEKLVDGWPAARIDELLPWAAAYTSPASTTETQMAA